MEFPSTKYFKRKYIKEQIITPLKMSTVMLNGRNYKNPDVRRCWKCIKKIKT